MTLKMNENYVVYQGYDTTFNFMNTIIETYRLYIYKLQLNDKLKNQVKEHDAKIKQVATKQIIHGKNTVKFILVHAK